MTKLYLFLALVLLAGCSQTGTKETVIEENVTPREYDSLAISFSSDLVNKFTSVQLYYNEGLKCIISKDTIGAEIYFNNALEEVSDLTEDERDIIGENPLFAEILKDLDSDYKRLFPTDEIMTDREEVMEEIGEFEESVILNENDSLELSLQMTDSSNNFPLVINKRVASAMKYFQTRGRGVFTRWLERSGRYKELYQEMLREENVPEDLFYLAMVESGFVNHAYSYARAAGPWQFMAATGAMYGLRNSWWFDERRDPLKATRAAGQHLSDLYDMFDDWLLAIAGYNVSPRKVMRRTQIQKTRDFWKLNRLPRQTLNYIPTYMAATIMAKNPEKYGFYPNYQEPFVVDTVIVNEAIDLSLVAQWTDTTYKAIKDLNPAVMRWCTPPGVKNFSVNIPKGKRLAFHEGLRKIPESEKLSYIRYRIKSGDAIGAIAQKYGVSVSILKKQNRMKTSRIYAGKYLIIPVPKNKGDYYASLQKTYKPRKKKNRSPKSIPGRKKVTYVVKTGDNLGQIAEDYNIRASEIRLWNGLSYRSYIYPGQKLTIFTPSFEDIPASTASSKQVVRSATLQTGERYYTVKSGDSLWKIAQDQNTTVEKLKDRNGIDNNIKPGEKIVITP